MWPTEDKTVVIGSTSGAPTGEMITHLDIEMPRPESLSRRLADVSRAGHQHWADAGQLTEAAFGDSVTANLFVVGMAFQAGALPVPVKYLHEAIEINGVAVEENLAAFMLGRQFVVDADAVTAAVTVGVTSDDEGLSQRQLLERELEAFGGRKCAEGWRGFVEQAEQREIAVMGTSGALTEAVAANLYKLWAYKDEYEVARLLLDDEAAREAEALGGRVYYRLHPPMLRSLGLKRKIKLGRWPGLVCESWPGCAWSWPLV